MTVTLALFLFVCTVCVMAVQCAAEGGGLERWKNTAQGVRSRTRQLPQPHFAQVEVAGITSDKFVPRVRVRVSG